MCDSNKQNKHIAAVRSVGFDFFRFDFVFFCITNEMLRKQPYFCFLVMFVLIYVQKTTIHLEIETNRLFF